MVEESDQRDILVNEQARRLGQSDKDIGGWITSETINFFIAWYVLHHSVKLYMLKISIWTNILWNLCNIKG
jgi:hypothetical protein